MRVKSDMYDHKVHQSGVQALQRSRVNIIYITLTFSIITKALESIHIVIQFHYHFKLYLRTQDVLFGPEWSQKPSNSQKFSRRTIGP